MKKYKSINDLREVQVFNNFLKLTEIPRQSFKEKKVSKKDGFDFDFDNDPIPVQIDGDELNTGGKTTLGADNGIGVAVIMSILEDKEMSHPPITAIFTTVEEDDFSGVNNLSKDWIIGNRAINIDDSKDLSLIHI